VHYLLKNNFKYFLLLSQCGVGWRRWRGKKKSNTNFYYKYSSNRYRQAGWTHTLNKTENRLRLAELKGT